MDEQEETKDITDEINENNAELNLLVRTLGMTPEEFFKLARWEEVMNGDNMTPVLIVLATAFITINSLVLSASKNKELADALHLRLDLAGVPNDTSGDEVIIRSNPIVRNSD